MLQWFREGIISYARWQEFIKNIYIKRGKATRQKIVSILSKHIYCEGAKELIQYLSSKGYPIVLNSGALDIIVEMVAKELNIKYYFANNHFIFDEDGLLKDIVFTGDENEAKVKHLSDVMKELGVKPEECICIGDGGNDIEIFKLTKHGITFKGSPIEPEAWKVVERLSDIKSLL